MLSNFIHVHYCYNYLVNQIPMGLLLYSHLPGAIAALLFGIFLLYHARKFPNITLFIVCVSFAAWCFLDLASWFAFLGSGMTMFTWALTDLLALVFFFFSYYFLYTFIIGKDLPIWQKLIGAMLLLPTSIWIALGKTLTMYDANTCEALDNGFHLNYLFSAEGVFLLAVIIFSTLLYRGTKDYLLRKKIIFATIGVLFFLGFFLFSALGVNYLVSSTAVQFAYNFEIYGLFGMPILLMFLGYLIVRYQVFNLKVFGAQALVFALVVLVGSEFAFINSLASQILVAVTLVLTGAIGILLIRSVRKEIEHREQIAKLAENLEISNEQLSEFMSLATHEIRNPATFIKGFAAGALEGDLGEITPAVKDGMQKIFIRADDIIHLGNQYLNKSKLELNQLTYEFAPLDFGKLASDLVREFQPAAAQRNIAVTADIDKNQTYDVQADGGKIKEVLGNLIDNSIKYTPSGSVTISLAKNEKTVTVKIADTGVGIPAETIPQLFKKFSRADAQKVNLLGSGLGLYLAKIFVDAHRGRIWVESEGKDKGSTFFVELPA